MSALFERITKGVKSTMSGGIPLTSLDILGWAVSSASADAPEGIYRAHLITPWIEPPHWKLDFAFGTVDLELGADLSGEPELFALVWDRSSMSAVIGEAALRRIFGLARPLTPTEVIELLIEEDV